LRRELVEFDQAFFVSGIAAAFACVFGGDAHQAHGLALQGAFDLLAQVRLRLVKAHTYFEPGVALGFGEQVDIGQVRQRSEDVGQGRGLQPLQVDRARYQERFDADQSFALERHVENLVFVADLGKRQRDRRATVANAFFAVHLLRLVQVAEGNIADTFVEQVGGQRLGIADDQAALGVFRH